MGSLKTYSKDANCHMLAKTFKFYTTKMQCAHDNQEEFRWVVMWATGFKGKEWSNQFGQ